MSGPVVVILAAGEGTRMRSAVPKLLHPLCGRAMIAWPVDAAREAGASKVIVVTSPTQDLRPALDRPVPDSQIEFAIQQRPRGTADAVMAAAQHIPGDSAVIVLYGDVPLIRARTIRELAEAHTRSGAAATMTTMVLEDPRGYGRVVRAPDGTVERVVETKAPGDASELELHIREVNAGIYAFEGRELLAALEQVGDENAQGELYLPDVLPILRGHERTVVAHEISDPSEMLGVNDRVALAQAWAVAQRRIHERHMLAGVTIVDPAATVIEADVHIGQDAVIAPFSTLEGATRVGERASIGPLATLVDTQVGQDAKILHSYLIEADVGDGVTVGPFAYLRPGALLREGAKAGTFVEVKNASIGPGAKVPHLSYIGDAEIGEDSNIGAGTITANYDGHRKHRTRIGARVKVSVDTAFVAPVTVGDDAYTAAGSVISKDVPPGALGVARSRQQNIEGYAERRREREEAGSGDGTAETPRGAEKAQRSAREAPSGDPPH